MIYPIPYRRWADPSRTPLLHLFETTLAPQLLPRGYEPGVLSIDRGACIWLPTAKLAVTTVGSESPIEGFTHAQTAELSNMDILAFNFDDHSDLVECQLELFASYRTHKFSVPRLALWLSPHGLAGLVPVLPRSGCNLLPPCFALMPTGIKFLADPFLDDDEWQDGIARATEATRSALAVPRRKPVLKLVR